jgi:hypothetical protein
MPTAAREHTMVRGVGGYTGGLPPRGLVNVVNRLGA